MAEFEGFYHQVQLLMKGFILNILSIEHPTLHSTAPNNSLLTQSYLIIHADHQVPPLIPQIAMILRRI